MIFSAALFGDSSCWAEVFAKQADLYEKLLSKRKAMHEHFMDVPFVVSWRVKEVAAASSLHVFLYFNFAQLRISKQFAFHRSAKSYHGKRRFHT